jgi:Lrp/AsnC family transcriptional regulator for asnA, asnC and gidA
MSTIDDTDRELIRVLQRDGRLSNTEIARTLGVTEATIRKRLARLVGDELIQIVAVPSPRAAGQTMSAVIGVSVELGLLRAVAADLVQSPEVRYVGLSTGRYDLMLEAFFTDQEHVLSFVTERLGGLEGVREVETSLILEVAKFSYEWEIP